MLLMFACDGGVGTPECVDNGQCEEGQACVDEVCSAVECLESSDCNISEFCDPRSYECRTGCEADTDCLAGQECNTQTHECEDSACRTAELDCSVGQVCDTVTGACTNFGGELCDTQCDVGEVWDNCPNGSTCQVTGQGDTCSNDNQCGGGGWVCDDFIVQENCSNNSQCPDGSTCDPFWGYCIMGLCHSDHCMSSCNPNNADSCPSGFECYPDGFGGGSCSGDCAYYAENGYL
jgi:hypothetical protein